MTRIENDLYETSEKLSLVLLNNFYFNLHQKSSILEPCAGNGAISNLLKLKFPNVYTNDLINRDFLDFNEDATNINADFWSLYDYDLIITNPPFKVATPILENALHYSKRYVAFLLRLSYAEPVKSRQLLLKKYSDNQVRQFVVNPRPKFKNDGKADKVTVMWVVWDKLFSWKRAGINSPFQYVTEWNK